MYVRVYMLQNSSGKDILVEIKKKEIGLHR